MFPTTYYRNNSATQKYICRISEHEEDRSCFKHLEGQSVTLKVL